MITVHVDVDVDSRLRPRLAPAGACVPIPLPTPRKYDWAAILALRQQDPPVPWAEIAAQFGAPSAGSLRSAWAHTKRRGAIHRAPGPEVHTPAVPEMAAPGASEPDTATAVLTADQISRITSLDDLIQFFKIDLEAWQVAHYRVNKWETASKNKHTQRPQITPLYQVTAKLVPNIKRQIAVAEETLRQVVADMQTHAPPYRLPSSATRTATGEPVLFVFSLRDPHFGMLAWGRETGQAYDLEIAQRDYAAAVDYLLGVARQYNVARILFPVGDDLLHVDAFGPIGGRGGVTTRGTPQDIDSRLPKMFTAARRAVVAAIDRARLLAPVDVVVVPGNHDQQSMYRLGEVLQAWYRHDSAVQIENEPRLRKFYGWGKNAFMLTHGEELHRKRDNLPLIFATECPPDLWVRSTCREVHTGHNHAALAGGYYPTAELDEHRGIRVRSLPALTPLDSWHVSEGYRHQRAAAALVYRESGGLVGLHEFNLD